MATKSLMRPQPLFTTLFPEFFKPWDGFFDNERLVGKMLKVPAVNIVEEPTLYTIFLAAPGLRKEDFVIDLEANLLTISVEKEEKVVENEERFTLNEYNYTSFNRSFTLPENVKYDAIEAKYEDGVLKLMIPKKVEDMKTIPAKQITVK